MRYSLCGYSVVVAYDYKKKIQEEVSKLVEILSSSKSNEEKWDELRTYGVDPDEEFFKEDLVEDRLEEVVMNIEYVKDLFLQEESLNAHDIHASAYRLRGEDYLFIFAGDVVGYEYPEGKGFLGLQSLHMLGIADVLQKEFV